MRTTRRHVTFAQPFKLSDIGELLPPGDYLIETDEEEINGADFIAHRRVATWIHVHRRGLTEIFTIDPIELEACLSQDGATGTETLR